MYSWEKNVMVLNPGAADSFGGRKTTAQRAPSKLPEMLLAFFGKVSRFFFFWCPRRLKKWPPQKEITKF
jgi:hypothetical protein